MTTAAVGELVPQAHGGALRNGGTNKGGMGAVPSVVRDRARSAWYDRIPILEKIADGEVVQKVKIGENETDATVSAEPSDRIRALAELSKVGMSATVTMDDVRERLEQQAAAIRELLPPVQADALFAKLAEVWR